MLHRRNGCIFPCLLPRRLFIQVLKPHRLARKQIYDDDIKGLQVKSSRANELPVNRIEDSAKLGDLQPDDIMLVLQLRLLEVTVTVWGWGWGGQMLRLHTWGNMRKHFLIRSQTGNDVREAFLEENVGNTCQSFSLAGRA